MTNLLTIDIDARLAAAAANIEQLNHERAALLAADGEQRSYSVELAMVSGIVPRLDRDIAQALLRMVERGDVELEVRVLDDERGERYATYFWNARVPAVSEQTALAKASSAIRLAGADPGARHGDGMPDWSLWSAHHDEAKIAERHTGSSIVPLDEGVAQLRAIIAAAETD